MGQMGYLPPLLGRTAGEKGRREEKIRERRRIGTEEEEVRREEWGHGPPNMGMDKVWYLVHFAFW